MNTGGKGWGGTGKWKKERQEEADEPQSKQKKKEPVLNTKIRVKTVNMVRSLSVRTRVQGM